MAHFALFLTVFGALGVVNVVAAQSEEIAKVESAEPERNIETLMQEGAAEDSNGRWERDVPKTENHNLQSQFIRSEKTSTGDHIIWRDNSETRKQGQVPTVTRVLYHGIYPSLNITEPLNGSHSSKYRQKRDAAVGSSQDSLHADSRLSTSSGTASTNELGYGWQTGERRVSKTNATIDNTLDATQQYSQPQETPAYRTTGRPVVGSHYEQAYHSRNRAISPYSSYEPSSPTDYAQGSIRYRTMYLPSNSEYRGDPENKGRVKLISVGYYGINESTADLRSYRNPKVDRHPQTTVRLSRAKRDNHWCWLNNLFKSIRIMKNPETSEKENEIPRSEPLKMDVSEVNEEAQDVYGYSSNGHGHPHPIDRIFIAQNEQIQNPNQNPNSDEKLTASSTTPQRRPSSSSTPFKEQTTPNSDSEEMPLPADEPVLIQAPPRKIVCRPPKRLARGRCRTVW